MSEFRTVATSSLVFPPADRALRKPPQVTDKDWDEFLIFKDGIGQNGLLNPFSVSENADGTFTIIDGSRRAKACMMLAEEGHPDFQNINVQVRTEAEWDALELQIVGNHTAKKTPNSNYINSLQKLLIAKNYTIAELSQKVSMTEGYIENLLKLNHLPEIAKAAFDEKKMTVTNAIQLNKLPNENIEDMLIDACTLSGQDFAVKVSEKLNELAKARRAEKAGVEKVFEPSAKYMKKDEATLKLRKAESMVQDDPSEFNRGYLLAWQEIFSLDEVSVADQKAAWDKEQSDAEKNKEERAKERAKKKTAEAVKLLQSQGVKIEMPEGDIANN
jgi:ParB/RepB/Spo0J family partition protein